MSFLSMGGDDPAPRYVSPIVAFNRGLDKEARTLRKKTQELADLGISLKGEAIDRSAPQENRRPSEKAIKKLKKTLAPDLKALNGRKALADLRADRHQCEDIVGELTDIRDLRLNIKNDVDELQASLSRAESGDKSLEALLADVDTELNAPGSVLDASERRIVTELGLTIPVAGLLEGTTF